MAKGGQPVARLSPQPQQLSDSCVWLSLGNGASRSLSDRAATREGRSWGSPTARPPRAPNLHSIPEAGWWLGREAMRTATVRPGAVESCLPAAQPGLRAVT